ncbi:MAG: amidohydrolase [Candidatus Thorarchaeota archaeon]|nr:amidohydrolase [Candidatus Thorarchaeota archaeon]
MVKAIKNATILCPVNGLIEGGTIVFDDEKIHAVGKDAQIPQNADVIDAEGKYVLPGFIDAHCHQGLFDGSIGWAGADGNEMTAPLFPELRGIDSFNPDEPSLKEVLRGGVTCINTGPGSGNVIGGEAFVVKSIGSGVVDEMIVLSPSGLKIALGENPKRVHGNEKRTPSTRMGTASLLRKTFTEGMNYLEEWRAYGAKAREAKDKGEVEPKKPKRDLGMETIAKVLKREVPLHAHAHRADDIATIIRIAKEFNLRLVLIHCTEGHKIKEHIADADVPAVVGPTIYWVSKPETRDRGFFTAVELNKAGVKVALQTDSLTPMNYFPLLPMYAIKDGMSRDDALKCVTLNPAEILDIDDRVGSLEPGKDADIIVWSGHPFEFYSKVEHAFINGKEIDLE